MPRPIQNLRKIGNFHTNHLHLLGSINAAPVTHLWATVELFALQKIKSIKVSAVYLEDNLLWEVTIKQIIWEVPVGWHWEKNQKRKQKKLHTFTETTTFPSQLPANECQTYQRGGALSSGWPKLPIYKLSENMVIWHLLPLLTQPAFLEFWSPISTCLQTLSINRLQFLFTNINIQQFLN